MEQYLYGIDLGGTTTKFGFFTIDGELIEKFAIKTDLSSNGANILSDIAVNINNHLVKNQLTKSNIKGIGIGVPGPVTNGIANKCVNLGWENVPVVAKLSAAIGAPVFLDNDVRVAALGELAQGEARGCSNFIYLAVGTGIGSGIFIAGQLLRGPHWSAGEVGHMVLDPLGPDCNCGSRGCLEALASATAIAREGRAAAAADADSLLRQLAKTPDAIDAALVFEAAACGDQGAAQVVNTAMTWLGIGVANLVRRRRLSGRGEIISPGGRPNFSFCHACTKENSAPGHFCSGRPGRRCRRPRTGPAKQRS